MPESKYRNLFEIENARDLTRQQMVDTFIESPDFKRLLSSKNHIVLGERGSGKTALAKMLSHDHLSLLQVNYAQQAVQDKLFIGMYVSIKTEWVSGLRNKPWQDEREKEAFFQWRLNVATCLALLKTLRSCLDRYIRDLQQRVIVERELIKQISESWSEGSQLYATIVDLQRYLEDIEHIRQQQLARKRVTGRLREGEEFAGIPFDAELFEPLRRGITLATRALNLPEECKWLLCLDEAETLDTVHHRILNTYLRADSGNLVFKITTTPYSHYTQDTNSGKPLIYGHDYEYVYIGQNSIFEEKEWVKKLFEKRAKSSAIEFQDITLEKLLGRSILMIPKKSEWTLDSEEMTLLEKYSTKPTYERAKRLIREEPERAKDEIARKFHGALLLRKAVEVSHGHKKLDIFSGVEMAIRCGDCNPRRLVRIFNSFLTELLRSEDKKFPIARTKQTDILIEFSYNELERTKSSAQLYEFLQTIGTYMSDCLHKMPLTSNLSLAIDVSKDVSDEIWKVIEKAVEWGYLFPIRNSNHPDRLPHKKGRFHLGYVLAPYFKIMPRKGHPIPLSTIQRHKPLSKRLNTIEGPLFDNLSAEESAM